MAEASRMAKLRWWRSLLARVTLTYAIGALMLSSTVALATFLLAQNQLVYEAESQHKAQTFYNAGDLRARIEPQLASSETTTTSAEADDQAAGNRYTPFLDQVSRPNGSGSLLLFDSGLAPSLTLNEDDLPGDLKAAILSNDTTAAQRRYLQDGAIKYAVGVRLDTIDAIYFEVLDLTDLENTLRLLRVILIGVAVTSSVAGAGLGYFTARRALAPVPRISNAARRIASGDFTAKLDMQADRDLAVLSSAFNDMIDAVSERIDRERRFTSDVSHELRSPLTTLSASVEVLQRRKDSLPKTAQQAVDLLGDDLARFQRLVEDLLEISRMEAGAAQLEISRFKLAEFLENAIAQSRSPEVILQSPDEVAEVAITADKRRLFQVMTNLINNAAKYAGGATGISFEVINERVQIVVDDAGPGVPAKERDRIFERFGRIGSEAGNRATGTGFGLGLSLVAEHVRLHGGQVWVTDRIDGQHGARFVVDLPLEAPSDDLDVVVEDGER